MNCKILSTLTLVSLLLAGCGGAGGVGVEATTTTTVTTSHDDNTVTSNNPPTSGNVSTTIDLSDFNSGRWTRSDSYSNGGDFMVGWRADHAIAAGDELDLIIDDDGGQCPGQCSLKPFAAGEIRTTADYGYGTYQVDMQASNASGTVTSMFTYVDTNTTPNHAAVNDEIDIEIPGQSPTTLQATYYRHGGTPNTQSVALGFDASAAYHTYSIVWLPNSISWKVDGQQIYSVSGSIHTLPTRPGQFILNFWVGQTAWLGAFTYTGPLTARYKNARFTPAD